MKFEKWSEWEKEIIVVSASSSSISMKVIPYLFSFLSVQKKLWLVFYILVDLEWMVYNLKQRDFLIYPIKFTYYQGSEGCSRLRPRVLDNV
ncbi:hypothetical protein D0466_12350 [Peribacillus glennii]|uniref:Uncharacterized protein n=1 Tax=Peribacillus glennii TaxID=2303991 RepID=A0A372LCA8_9BACI|nr:hypothetical protein D0466_12350 [Peribacillus glennii]